MSKLPTKIHAAILREVRKPLSLEELEIPKLKRGQVLVKISYSGICRSQLMEQQGKRGIDKWVPHLLGHEGVGEVVAIGEGVTKCTPGEQVVLSWIEGKGINAETPIYTDGYGKQVNAGKVTTFSNFSIVSENRVFKAPIGFNKKVLALFGCALLTGGGMALKYGNGNSDENSRMCVIGFGGVGSAAAIVLMGMKKKNIVIVEKSPERRELAKYLGFTDVLSNLEECPKDFDLVIEATGSVDAIENGFQLLKDNGTLVFSSHPESGAKICLDPHDLIKGKHIFGTWGGDVLPDEDIKDIGLCIKNSKIDLEMLIGQVFEINEINEALEYLESGKPGRALIRLSEGKSEG